MIRRLILRFIRLLNAKLTSASMRLTKWTGKSQVRIHPKHLAGLDAEHHWFTVYLEPTDVVLDAGCGNAAHALQAADRCQQIIGIDYDAQQLTIGHRLAVDQGQINLHLAQANAKTGLPFADRSFDKVLFLNGVEHLVQRQNALQEIDRVLKQNGTMLLAVPNRQTSWKRRLEAAGLFYYADPDHKIEYTQEELTAELHAGGFTIDGKLTPVVYDTPWAGLIDLIGGISLGVYRRLSRWKRAAAQRRPRESTGWRLRCRKRDRYRE